MSNLLIKYLVAENLFALRNGFGPVITLFGRLSPKHEVKDLCCQNKLFLLFLCRDRKDGELWHCKENLLTNQVKYLGISQGSKLKPGCFSLATRGKVFWFHIKQKWTFHESQHSCFTPSSIQHHKKRNYKPLFLSMSLTMFHYFYFFHCFCRYNERWRK